ncbi:MAG TPA: helix-turn-helix domain-containing protein [Anaerolineae bacterium]|nr:helix-turn-helix domain-containing protein [Anaerolineae bacterium]HQH38838.1 helix-turn-helix domain-containing protein [Anaerolineae bacterium]
MTHAFRIGIAIDPNDPYWVQVREAAYAKAQNLSIDLISLNLVDSPAVLSEEEQMALLEELLALELDALIAWALPEDLTDRIPQLGMPLVLLSETEIRHPLLTSPLGLHDIVQMGGLYLAEKLAGCGHGRVLAIGMPEQAGRQARSMPWIAGVRDAFRDHPEVIVEHIPCPWHYEYEQAYRQIHKMMPQLEGAVAAILGLSDALALAGRDAGNALGLLDRNAPVVGIGASPAALAAIAGGEMIATVEIRADELGKQAVELACRAAQGQALPSSFKYEARLVTAQNVAEVLAQKLTAIANLYSNMMHSKRQQQQQLLRQLETSLEISRRVGSILTYRQLSHEIANLIRANYGYDRVQIFRWLEQEQLLVLDQPDQGGMSIPLAGSGVLGQVLMRNEPIFIPDTHHSPRFPPDAHWPDTRARVVLPIRLGGQVWGLLDLHSHRSAVRTRQELVGLQSLADQLGTAISNATLYDEALQARVAAEKADQLKTRLLANVSHELRAPLNTILGFASAALTPSACAEEALPADLSHDLQHIYRSAEHLLRLINDLLDLSRAEIDELDLHLEFVEPRSFLEEVFHSIAGTATSQSDVVWSLQLPARLPIIQGDPVRLRQIFLNLLSNSQKFTEQGQIILGAEVLPPHLHLWVQDTGIGIPADWQQRIFEPFVTAEHIHRRMEGIGLGLSIAQRLVALHRGTMTLESQPGQGSTFHIYLPLPSLEQQPTTSSPAEVEPVLLLISAQGQPAAEIVTFSQRQGLEIRRVQAGEAGEAALAQLHPSVLAWDLTNANPADWGIIQQLRRHPHLCQAPFVLYGQTQSGEPALTLGMTNVITKPVSGETLLEAINALCASAFTGPILIVDDDPQARTLYRNIVEKALPNSPIRTAENGVAALVSMAEEVPCLMLLDLMMPEMDGFEVLERMRAAQETRRVPVLVLSGRMLTLEDIKRLEKHALVTVQSKDILSEGETVEAVKRCLAGDDALPPYTSALVKRILAYFHQNYDRPILRREVAQAVGVSENHLTRIFGRELGLSPWDYLNRYRIKQAKELLLRTSDSITAVALRVGFDDPAYFSRVFRKQVGISPSAFRQQAP